MAHTFTHLLTHIVFSTKDRRPVLDAALKERLFPYMGGILRELDAIPHLINGPVDHVHILTALPASKSLSDIMRVLKTNSSRWTHEQFPQSWIFAWQTGYGAFSVSKSSFADVRDYIANQEEHHRRQTFQEEFIALLKRHALEYDERYLWE